MILTLLLSLWRDDYPRRYGFILEIFSILMMLVVFWYTSQAFTPTLDLGVSYFDYLVTAEVILYLPMLLLQHNIRLGKKMAHRGTFDFFLVNKVNISTYFFYNSIIYFFKDSIRLILLIILSVYLFSFKMDVAILIILLLYIVLVTFIMAVFGMTVGLSLIFWGRGEGSFGQLISLSSILAGAYFPLNVFPDWLKKISFTLNPMTSFLEYGRHLVRGDWNDGFWGLLIWPIVAILFYRLVYFYGLKKYLKDGPPAGITI